MTGRTGLTPLRFMGHQHHCYARRLMTDPARTIPSILMSDRQGLDYITGELNTLEGMIEEVAGPLAADGGYLSNDIYGNLPDLGWGNLTRTFLKT